MRECEPVAVVILHSHQLKNEGERTRTRTASCGILERDNGDEREETKVIDCASGSTSTKVFLFSGRSQDATVVSCIS